MSSPDLSTNTHTITGPKSASVFTDFETTSPQSTMSLTTGNSQEVHTGHFNLCSEGDVILVATGARERENYLEKELPDPQPEAGLFRAKIRVSSIVMGLASKVFKALFSPTYSEGQAIRELSSSQPKEIVLEDDNPYALGTLCEVLHHAIKPDTAERLPTKNFYDIAILADKYDCFTSLQFFTETVLARFAKHGAYHHSHCFKPQCTDEIRYDEILAAYLLDSSEYFALFTSYLVLESDPRQHVTERNPVSRLSETLPVGSLVALEDQGRQARDEIIETLNLFILRMHRTRSDVESNEFIAALMSTKVWPSDILHVSISKLLGLLQRLSATLDHSTDPLWEPDGDCIVCPKFGPGIPQCEHTINHLEHKISVICSGLCIDCVRCPEKSKDMFACRGPHSGVSLVGDRQYSCKHTLRRGPEDESS